MFAGRYWKEGFTKSFSKIKVAGRYWKEGFGKSFSKGGF